MRCIFWQFKQIVDFFAIFDTFLNNLKGYSLLLGPYLVLEINISSFKSKRNYVSYSILKFLKESHSTLMGSTQLIIEVDLYFPLFLQLPEKGPRAKWIMYKHVSDNSKKCLFVGKFCLSVARLQPTPAYVET